MYLFVINTVINIYRQYHISPLFCVVHYTCIIDMLYWTLHTFYLFHRGQCKTGRETRYCQHIIFDIVTKSLSLSWYLFKLQKTKHKCYHIISLTYRWCDKCLFTTNARDWFIDTLEWNTALLYDSLQGVFNVEGVLKAHALTKHDACKNCRQNNN